MQNVEYFHIPVALNILDTATYRFLRDFLPGYSVIATREEPLKGQLFTYSLQIPGIGSFGKIELVGVAEDGSICNLRIKPPKSANDAMHGKGEAFDEKKVLSLHDDYILAYLIYLKDEEIWHYDAYAVFDEVLSIRHQDLFKVVSGFLDARDKLPKVIFGGIAQEVSLKVAEPGGAIEIQMLRNSGIGVFKSLLGRVSCVPSGTVESRVVIRVLHQPEIPLPGTVP